VTDLVATQVTVLRLLRTASGRLTTTQVARRTGATRQAAIKRLKALEGRGLASHLVHGVKNGSIVYSWEAIQ